MSDSHKETVRNEMEESLRLTEKLASLGRLSAGIAHELVNPLSWVVSNIEMVREQILAARALTEVRRTRSLARAAADETSRRTIEEAFLGSIGRRAPFTQDVRDYEEQVADLGSAERRSRFTEFLSYCESSAASRAGETEETIELIEAAEEGLARMRRIVSDLREFSHPGNEEPGPVCATTCIDRVLTLLAGEIKIREVEIRRSNKLGSPILATPGRLDQVLLNLVRNALQASPTAARIRLRTRAENNAGVIEVADRGPGIPDDVAERIFEPFFTTKPAGEGVGLGLGISARILEDLGGSLTFRNRRLGRGTVFVVRLPLADEAP